MGFSTPAPHCISMIRPYWMANAGLPRSNTRKGSVQYAKQRHVACYACKPVTTLPNGLTVCYASKYDVSFLYREIFQEQVYVQHGLKLAAGDVVVDIGGNIGFFALFAAQRVGASGKVVTAEPIPTLQEKLLYNVKSHQAWCSAQGSLSPPYRPMRCMSDLHFAGYASSICFFGFSKKRSAKSLILHGYVSVGVSVASIAAVLMGVGSGKEQTMDFTYYSAAAG